MSTAAPHPLVLGDVTIHRIVEQEGPMFDVAQFFPRLTEEMLAPHRHWMVPRYFSADARVNLCVQSYLVVTPHHKILVDTCVGNHKERPNRPMWHRMASDRYEKSLAAAGFTVDDIDYVMCTHLHGDHVGWNTKLENGRWVPTFPKARYVFSGKELAHWTDRASTDAAGVPWITDSVLPIVAANRVELVASDHALGDLVKLMPTPGHTVDHFSVEVGRRGADALITGDAIHSPIQVHYPDLGMFSDWNQEIGGKSRRKLLERCCGEPTVFCPAHFASPSVGRIVKAGDGFGFVG